MEIYDEQGNLIENPDLTKGYLVLQTKIVHHETVAAVEEVFHYEVVKEYPNGGKIVEKIIDTPYQPFIPAWDEEVQYHLYVLNEEINPEDEDSPRTLEEQVMALQESNEMLIECVMELSTLLYT